MGLVSLIVRTNDVFCSSGNVDQRHAHDFATVSPQATYSGAGVGGDEAGVEGVRERMTRRVEIALDDGVVLHFRTIVVSNLVGRHIDHRMA